MPPGTRVIRDGPLIADSRRRRPRPRGPRRRRRRRQPRVPLLHTAGAPRHRPRHGGRGGLAHPRAAAAGGRRHRRPAELAARARCCGPSPARRAVVAPYPHSTLEPAFGPLEDEDGHLYLVADLPGLAADGTPRRTLHLEQIERARLRAALPSTRPTPSRRSDRASPAPARLSRRSCRRGAARDRRGHARRPGRAAGGGRRRPSTPRPAPGIDELRERVLAALRGA